MSDPSVVRLGGALGAEVSGIDLREPLDDQTFAVLEAALVEHQVLVLREQAIEAPQQLALARRFGSIEVHGAYPGVPGCPEVGVLEHTAERPSRIEKWHTDMTFRPTPPLGTLLHAQVVPAVGGDTLFSSTSAAFAGLSSRVQRLVDGLLAEHSFEHGFRESLAEPGGASAWPPCCATTRRCCTPWCGATRWTSARGCSSTSCSPPASTGCTRPRAARCSSCCFARPPRPSTPSGCAGSRARW